MLCILHAMLYAMVHAMVGPYYGTTLLRGGQDTWKGHRKDKMDMGRTPERACAMLKNKIDMERTPERACATLKPYCPQI